MTGARRWLRPVLGVLVACVFLSLIFRRVDWASVSAAWRAASPGPLLLALAALAADMSVRTFRWWWMLRALEPDLPLRSCFRPFILSLAVNNTMPLRAGDMVRALGFRDALRSSPARVVGTLVIERVLDMLVLLVFFFLGLLGAAGAFPPAVVKTSTALGAACVAAILFLVIAPRPLRALLEAVLRRTPLAERPFGRKLHEAADHFFETIQLVQSPARALQLVGLSLVAWVLEGAVFACVAWSLHTAVLPLGPWFSLATGTLATLLPSSPGYVGTFDYFAMLGLTAYGATRAAAAAFALLVHVFLWLPVTLAGAAYLVVPGGRDAVRPDAGAAETT